MKVFVSHKQQDDFLAKVVGVILTMERIDYYLDVMDEDAGSIDDVTAHLQGQLQSCTHLIAVVSEKTRQSWWVPWEIGIATERGMPLATYAPNGVNLPGYLKRWPYLISGDAVRKYAKLMKEKPLAERVMMKSASAQVRQRDAKTFHRTLRNRLGQL